MFDEVTMSHTVNISIVQDDLVEGDEFFYLNLTMANLSTIQRTKRLTVHVGMIQWSLPGNQEVILKDVQS